MIGLFIFILYLVVCFITHICVYTFFCHLYKKGYDNHNNENFADWYDRLDCIYMDALISGSWPISILLIGIIFLVKYTNILIKNKFNIK